MKLKEKKKSDFILAKEVVATLELHTEMIVPIEKAGNFRKYLRDHSKHIDKSFITRVVEDGLKVIRIK